MTPRKVTYLTGAELDCAVAKALGIRWSYVPTDPEFGMRRALCVAETTPNPHIDGFPVFAPSSNWTDDGPIIQRECITIWPDRMNDVLYWTAEAGTPVVGASGQTPLMAAMRALVASKLGDAVELP